jgi:hypothetical protein
MTTMALVRFFTRPRDFECFAKVGREQRGDADQVGMERGNFVFNIVERFTEVIITMKGRKRRAVISGVVIAQIAKLLRNRDRPPSAAAVIVFDADIDIRQMLADRGFEIGKADRLQAHVGVVEILDGRLD